MGCCNPKSSLLLQTAMPVKEIKERYQMSKETIIDNNFITLWFHPDTGIVHHWFNPDANKTKSGYRSAYRTALLKGVELMKERGKGKWLSDDRHFQEQSLEDVEWGQKNWVPKAIVAGWRYWAIVKPLDQVSGMSLQRLISKFAEFGVSVKVFTDPDDAQKWLESV